MIVYMRHEKGYEKKIKIYAWSHFIKFQCPKDKGRNH